jgi:hypothetical protein
VGCIDLVHSCSRVRPPRSLDRGLMSKDHTFSRLAAAFDTWVMRSRPSHPSRSAARP